MFIEQGGSLRQAARTLVSNLNIAGISTGVVATLFSTLGPAIIVINSARQGGLTEAQAVSWLFGLYVLCGLFTMFTALRDQIPVVIAYSIPGAVMMGALLTQFSLSQAVGAYLVVGLITLSITVGGIVKKLIQHIPVPIMLAMVGGVLISFGIGVITAAIQRPAIYGTMVAVFFCVMAIRPISTRVPPIVVTMVVGLALIHHFGMFKYVPLVWEIARPEFVAPEFDLRAILNIGVPLFFLVIGVQNIQAVGVLVAEGYRPPINAMYLFPSFVLFINAWMGSHPAVTAGPSTAICSSSAAGPRKDLRFIAAFFTGTFWLCFGLLAKLALSVFKLVPAEFAAVLAGLAMFDVFGSAFHGAFAGRFRSGAVVAFLVAVTNVSILRIGAPFWAIVFGVITSLVVERSDFKRADPAIANQP